jgi:excisionase family DNA binding protein
MITIGKTRIFTTEEIARKFKLHPRTISRYLKSGKLAGQKMGNRLYVSEDAIAELFRQPFIKTKKGEGKKKVAAKK